MKSLISFALGAWLGGYGWSLAKHGFYWAMIAMALTYNVVSSCLQ